LQLKAAWINPDSLLSSPLPPVTSPTVSSIATRASTQHLFPTQQFLLPPPLPASGTATPHNPLSKLGLRTLQGLVPPTPVAQVPAQNGGFRRSSFANIGRMFREQQAPPSGPARSFSMQSTTSNGSNDGVGASGGWGMYRHPGLSGGALGLHNQAGGGLANPLEASETALHAVNADEDEDEVE
jgi:hypothetical protein